MKKTQESVINAKLEAILAQLRILSDIVAKMDKRVHALEDKLATHSQ